jgi:ABC-2 type transport system ATP-binding protein
MDAGAPTIEAANLRKRFDGHTALDGISVSAAAGEVVGLLGPNGAGKTTTLSILAGILRPDSGAARIAGFDLSVQPEAARRKLGLVPQSIALYPALSAAENLHFFGRMQGLGAHEARSAAAKVLDQVGLADRADDVVATFSGGMKRRLNLACGMLHKPAALLLDEPTAGVDPQSRERIFAVVGAAAAAGAAVLYSTHYMEEVERLCHRAILIDRGRVVAAGTSAELIENAGAQPRIELVTRAPLPPGWSAVLDGVSELPVDVANRASLALANPDQVPEVLRLAERLGGEVEEFHLHRPNLQDAFIALTGHALRDAD